MAGSVAAGWLAARLAGWLAGCWLLAGQLASRLLAGNLAGWLAAGLASWLAASWLTGCLAAWLAVTGSLAGYLRKVTLCKTTALRWKSDFHYHLMLILNQNQTSTHEEYFACGTFSYRQGFVVDMFKHAHVIKSRGALGTGFTYAPVWQRAVNRQPDYRSDNS